MVSNPYKCHTCSATFNSREELEEHNRTQHSRYECEQCGQAFNSQVELDDHMQKMHREHERLPES